jgi:hypothetical protein
MFYWLNNNKQTDQGDKTEGLEVEGFERKIGGGSDWRGKE